MAAKKSSSGTAANVFMGLAALVGAYFVYKLFFTPKAQAASGSGGFVGGGYGAYGSGNNPYQYQQPSGLGQLLAGLGSLLGGGKGGGGSSGSGSAGSGAGTAAKIQTPQQLQIEEQAIAGYSSQANNASNPDLGGYSLNSLPPGYDSSSYDLSGDTIPNVAGPQLFDFGSNSYSPDPDLASYQATDTSGVDTQSVDLANYTIDNTASVDTSGGGGDGGDDGGDD